MAGRSARLGLGPFLGELDARLRALPADELRARLLTHAERLPGRERDVFLAIFTAGPSDAEVESGHSGTEGDDGLLSDIASFVESVRSGAYYEGWGWDPDLHEERAFGDESWADEMDALFEGAAGAFLAGGLDLAREAYGHLLNVLLLEQEDGAFCGPAAPEEMLQTDVAEAKARYLRALYETTAAPERAARLAAEVAALHYVGGAIRLSRVAETRRDDLPDLDDFLPGWIELVAAGEGLLGTEGRLLLTEAVELQRGSGGLAELAREPGRDQPELFLAWVDALAREGRDEDAAAACREALERLEPLGEVRARIAERLVPLAARQGDGDAVLEARRAAWRASPSTQRLLELVDTATALAVVEEVLATEADLVGQRGAGGNDRLACELLLLAGRVEPALAFLRAAAPLGWSSRSHPGPIVVPYLLVAGSGGPAPAPPGQEGGSLLAEQFEGIDNHGWCYPAAFFDPQLDEVLSESGADDPKRRFSAIPREELLLSARLASRLVLQQPLAESDRERWLAAGQAAVEERAAAVVGGKHRGAYEHAARLVVACAEAIALAEGDRRGAAFVADIGGRYPRHYAFRAELDRAVGASPLLPALPSRR